MTKRAVATGVVIAVLLMLAGLVAYRFLTGNEVGTREAIGIQVKKNIRAAFDVRTAETEERTSAALLSLAKLADTYDRAGIDESERHIHAVFHEDAARFLLASEAEEEDPNAALVADLIDRGVHVELDARTLDARGWDEGDVLPDVELVVAAHPRLIDLQLSGYSYVRY